MKAKYGPTLILSIFCALTCAVAEDQNGGSALQQPLRVGVIAPLTGGVASWGLSVRTAIELANRDSAHPAEIYLEDEETCIPTKALTAFTYNL